MAFQAALIISIIFFGTVSAQVPECPSYALPTTIEQLANPGQSPKVYLISKGIRVFNCSTGTPNPSSGGAVNVTSGGVISANGSTNLTGQGFYPDANGNGTFVLAETDTATGQPLRNEGTFNLTLDYSTVLFINASDGALPWARWSIFTIPEEIANDLGIGWGSRVDTVGGATPTDCSAKNSDNLVIVPYTAVYNFYPCPVVPGGVSEAWRIWMTIGAVIPGIATLIIFFTFMT